MATKTATGPKPVTEVEIKAAVQTWAKAESSAIWSLIKLVSRGLEGFTGGDRRQRLAGLRTQINWAANDTWGPGAADDRAAHISKIMKIADSAMPAHYLRWEKEGTGFYKAYQEFAVPQKIKGDKPKVVSSTPPSAADKAADKKRPDVVSVPTEKIGNGDAPAGAGQVWIAPPEGAGTTEKPYDAAVEATKPRPEDSVADFTMGWVVQIESDGKKWTRLLDNLTDKRRTILTPGMVVEVFTAISKKKMLFRNSIELMLQQEYIKEAIVEWIRDNPTLMDGIDVAEKKIPAPVPKAEAK